MLDDLQIIDDDYLEDDEHRKTGAAAKNYKH